MPVHIHPISRRKFLAGTIASMALAQSKLPGAETQASPDLWALFSDTHLLSAESIRKHYSSQKATREKRSVTVSQNFNRFATQINALPKKPAGLLLNGDCVHVGGKQEHEQLAEKFALFKDTPIHVTMGNHDHRDDFRKAFQKRKDKVLMENRHVSLVKSRHANFVLLDSLTMDAPEKPVKGPGRLGREQMAWFESVVDAESDKPMIVMFHHNIDPSEEYEKRSGKKEIIHPSASAVKPIAGLEDSDHLLDLLQTKPHVKAIVTGHMHQYRIFKWRKLHFISLPAVGYHFHPKEPIGWLQCHLRESGADLELRTLDPKQAGNRTKTKLTWS